MGKGVVATQNAEFLTEDFDSPIVQSRIFELAEKLLHEWFEVVPEIIKKEE